MKLHILLLISVLGLTSSMHAQNPGLIWSNPISVADGATYGKSWPRLALTANDVPVVMWGDPGSGNVFVARLSGGSFSTPVDVVPGNLDAFSHNWTGPDIAARGDSVFVVFKALPETSGSIYTVRSVDGGQNFSDTVKVENIDPGFARYPGIDLMPGGNPVVAFMRFEPGYLNPRYEVAVSNDGGQSYAGPVSASASAPGEACDCCPTDIAVEGNRQLLPFRNNNNHIRDNWLALSTNNGVSFDTTLKVDSSNWFFMACPSQGSDAAFMGDTALTAWMTGEFGPSQVWLSATDLNTYASTSKRIDTSSNAIQEHVRITARGDTIGLVWEDFRNQSNDCYFSFSVTGPAGLLNSGVNATTPTTGNQTNPDVVFRNGVFHIVYRDIFNDEVVYRTAILDFSINTDVPREIGFELFPNPAQDRFAIRSSDPEFPGSRMRLFDGTGKICIDRLIGANAMEIDVEDLPKGLYLIEISNGPQRAIRKLLLE